MVARFPYKVFLSYSHEDKQLRNKVKDALIENGLSVWTDELIKDGSKWKEQIDNAINKTSAFVVIITRNSLVSDEVKHEIQLAAALAHPRYLVLCGSVEPTDLPDELKQIQVTDYRSRKVSIVNRVLAMQRLSSTIKQAL
jgi:hypothetical protein